MAILPGDGDVEIDIAIDPVDLVPYDNVIGQWYDGTDWSAAPWVQASQGLWDLDVTVAAGYHLQTWELFSEGYETFKVAGAAEAVYVRQSRTTAGVYNLNEANIGPAINEGAAIVIIWEAPSPIMTMFTDSVTEVAYGQEYTLTTITDADPIDSHAWYADGVLLPAEVSADITATAPMDDGMVNYSKVGFKGNIITSASKLVVFVEFTAAQYSVDGTIESPSGSGVRVTLLNPDYSETAYFTSVTGEGVGTQTPFSIPDVPDGTYLIRANTGGVFDSGDWFTVWENRTSNPPSGFTQITIPEPVNVTYDMGQLLGSYDESW